MEKASSPVRGRVSVITPVYNGEKHLFRLLDSILAQSWDDIEMILSDDGSSDRTLKIAESYREKFKSRGFRYQVVTAGHRNASAAINGGLPLVTGEFLIWPDSDDWLEKDSVRRRAEFLQKNPQYACVRSLSRYVDESGQTAERTEPLGDLENERLFFPVLEFKTFICCGCYMLRSEAFFKIYPRRRIPEYEVGQNFQMLLPCLYFYPCPTLREPLYVVLVHEDSHSRRARSFKEAKERCTGFERLMEEIIALCGITDKGELRRIARWRLRLRYLLYCRYQKRLSALPLMLPLALRGGLHLWDAAFLLNGSGLHRLYHRLKGIKKGPAEK